MKKLIKKKKKGGFLSAFAIEYKCTYVKIYGKVIKKWEKILIIIIIKNAILDLTKIYYLT